MAYFITLEGGDGSGKSTLLAQIEKHLNERKLPFITTREPGGTKLAEGIRHLLLKQEEEPMNPLVELLLFEAARADHVDRVIRPALAQGKHVICDRFTHSTLAFQGYGRGLSIPAIEYVNKLSTVGLEPDIVIWLKLSPSDAKKRMIKRGVATRLDSEDPAFHRAVFEGYEKMVDADPERFIVLDALQAEEAVFQELLLNQVWLTLFEGRA
jgi:dTMP kinase